MHGKHSLCWACELDVLWCRYVVTSDPVGAKIGNGGATMHALEQLQAEIGPEELVQGEYLYGLVPHVT